MAASLSPSPEADAVSIGDVLDGRYRIDAVLGAGGMGRVYRGEHTGIGRAVAIKVLHADLGRNREATARFQREALASGRLDHPNIVGVSDFGVLDDGACFLVMEALEGESLGERLERERRIHWREAVAIMRGVFAGLAHAHERGVVHRDIKPDNIFLARKEREIVVKILDFGIAKLAAGTGEDPAATRAGLTVGTPAYLSPEQAVGGTIGPASDLYSATTVLFEMIAGRTPFDEKEPLAMLGAHVSREPPRVREVAPEVEMPSGLEELIQHGLVKTSADRIASAAAYIHAIDSICATVQAYGSSPNHVPPPHLSNEQLGRMPTSSLTPVPGAMSMHYSGGTPMPMSLASMQSGGFSMPDSVTPMPVVVTPQPMAYTTPPPVSGAAPTALLVTPDVSAQQRAVSLPSAPAIPKTWIKRGAMVIGVCVLLAIVAVLASGGGDKPVRPADKAGSAGKAADRPEVKAKDPKGDAPEPKSVEPAPPPLPTPAEDAADHATKFKAALHDLQSGKTCAARRIAVGQLRDLGDPKAIPHLKRARYRMRGGVLGIGDDNTNGCLVKDADAAIKALTPSKSTPKK